MNQDDYTRQTAALDAAIDAAHADFQARGGDLQAATAAMHPASAAPSAAPKRRLFEPLASEAFTAPSAAEAIRAATAALAPAMRERDAPPYPVSALGPLADACAAIAGFGQVQPAMVGQALLGAASLLTQGLFNVQTLAGPRPLALYLLTLGDSGDGKSTAQRAALWAVAVWQKRARERYVQELEAFEAAQAKRKKNDEPPRPPICPYRLVNDPTIEGLRRDLEQGIASQGVFTDEAAAILSGHGMSADHRSKTAGTYSKLWDAGHLSVSRATARRIERYGLRIATHWLVQPTAAAETLGDPLLSALGFWPRFLIAWPSPQPPRRAREFEPTRHPAVAQYWQRCDELLAEPLPEDCDEAPLLRLSDEARCLLNSEFESFERRARLGNLRSVKPFGLRAAEQACRVAGVLAAFAGRHAVSKADMAGALALVEHSLATWAAVIDEAAVDPRASDGLRLFTWLVSRPEWRESLAVIVNRGPSCVRTKARRDAALEALEGAGLVRIEGGFVQALALAAPPACADSEGTPANSANLAKTFAGHEVTSDSALANGCEFLRTAAAGADTFAEIRNDSQTEKPAQRADLYWLSQHSQLSHGVPQPDPNRADGGDDGEVF